MAKYRGTGTASRFTDNHYQNRVMPLEIEADSDRQARTKALRQMRDAYPKADGYTHVVALVEAGEEGEGE